MLCLATAALLVPLMTDQVTLSWRHSVEKTLWQEDWSLQPGGRIVLTQARVQGSGAGMDPPPEAIFADGFWRWTPVLPAQNQVIMRRSGATADWQVCVRNQCQGMDAFVPAEADPVVLTSCR